MEISTTVLGQLGKKLEKLEKIAQNATFFINNFTSVLAVDSKFLGITLRPISYQPANVRVNFIPFLLLKYPVNSSIIVSQIVVLNELVMTMYNCWRVELFHEITPEICRGYPTNRVELAYVVLEWEIVKVHGNFVGFFFW